MKYTPPSIEAELKLATGRLPSESALIEVGDDRYVDLQLGSGVPVSAARAMERRGQISQLYGTIADADVVVVTLGLIEAWFDLETGSGICAAPAGATVKRYPGRFAMKVLSFDEARDSARRSMNMLFEMGAKDIVVTTSPVPLGRTFTTSDVIVANNFSKSVLRVVAQELAAEFARVDYYPSYEMVMYSDPLNSWENDQRHVSDSRVGLVVSRFIDTYLPGVGGDERDARSAYSQAMIHFGRKEYCEALAKIRSAARLSGDVKFDADRAKILAATDNVEEALTLMTEVAARTGNIKHRQFECDLLIRLGRNGEAIEKLNGVWRDFPASSLAPTMIARAYCRQGDVEAATKIALDLSKKLQWSPKEGLFVYKAVVGLLDDAGEIAAADRVAGVARRHYGAKFNLAAVRHRPIREPGRISTRLRKFLARLGLNEEKRAPRKA